MHRSDFLEIKSDPLLQSFKQMNLMGVSSMNASLKKCCLTAMCLTIFRSIPTFSLKFFIARKSVLEKTQLSDVLITDNLF